jgi:AraC-like DNA-binding protein
LGYAWLASHSLREALNRFVRYLRVVSEKSFLKLEENSRGLVVAFTMALLGMRVPAQIDMVMAMLIHMCRLNYGEALMPLAATYVQDPDIELVEVAFLLGFSDQSAFSRAFKRWTGKSPSESRKVG